MWRHKNCGGELKPTPDNDTEVCIKCDRYIHNHSDTYLYHDIIANDGKFIGDQGGNYESIILR